MAIESESMRTVKLRECAAFQEGYVNPPQGIPEYFGGEVKWLRAVDLNDSFVLETSRRLSRAGYESAGKSALLFEPDTLAISKSGTIGRLGILKDFMCGNRAVINIRVDLQKCDNRFIFYSLLHRRSVIEELATGSVQRNLYCSVLGDLEISLPSLTEQKAIARILGTLDDKIELNRRMNATLEALARALFQSWFVDFDPVRAKLDGRQPAGLDEATAALFPSHFQDSPLGHIPEGWTVERVGQVVDCVGGGTPSTAEPKYWEGGLHHWTTPKDFSSLQAPILLDTDRKLTDSGIAKISSGLLPAGTLLLSSRAPVGYLAIAAMPVAINQGFIAMKCNERASNYFMLNWCQTNMAEIESRATGTTFAEISKQNFRPIPVVLPPKELMAVFTDKVAPLYAKISDNLYQSRTLATLRDSLLPKLLSGEMSVAQAEQIAPNVFQFPDHASDRTAKKTTDEFVEAVVISQLVRKLATTQYPLGRKRYNKLAYLAHRKAEDDVTQHYLKKAAGPYSPWAKYGGPERIAQQNGYVKQAKSGPLEGLIVGDKIDKIDNYVPNYPVCVAIDWVIGKFRFKKNDDLELLATVDFAALDLLCTGKDVTTETIKGVIATNKAWSPKLNRAIFSDENIDRALVELAGLFPATYA